MTCRSLGKTLFIDDNRTCIFLEKGNEVLEYFYPLEMFFSLCHISLSQVVPTFVSAPGPCQSQIGASCTDVHPGYQDNPTVMKSPIHSRRKLRRSASSFKSTPAQSNQVRHIFSSGTFIIDTDRFSFNGHRQQRLFIL